VSGPAGYTSRVESPLNSRTFGLLLVALAWAVFLTIIGSPEVMLFTVPVFMLAAPLALGHYVGEELIAALGRIAGRARPSATTPGAARNGSAATPIRSSLLIASNLAGRAPPLLAA